MEEDENFGRERVGGKGRDDVRYSLPYADPRILYALIAKLK